MTNEKWLALGTLPDLVPVLWTRLSGSLPNETWILESPRTQHINITRLLTEV